MWPTPGAAKAGNDIGLNCSGDGREKPNKLAWAVVKLLPAAKGRDWKGQSERGIHAPGDSLARGDGKPIGGQLSPDWVELLQGYPKGWTDVGVTDGKTEPRELQPE